MEYSKEDNYNIYFSDLMALFTSELAEQQINYVIEFEGKLNIQRLKLSIIELLNKLPILTCIYDESNHLFKRSNLDFENFFELFETENITNNLQVNRFIAKQLDSTKDNPIKFGLIRNIKNDILCVKVNHIISDASGVKLICTYLSEIYTTGKINSYINYNRNPCQIFNIANLENKLIETPIPNFLPKKFNYCRNNKFIYKRTIENSSFYILNSLKKEFNVTINDILLTALYSAIFKEFNLKYNTTLPIMIPVDLRRYVDNYTKHSIANFSSSIYLNFNNLENENFNNTLIRIRDLTINIKNNSPGLIEFKSYEEKISESFIDVKEFYKKISPAGSAFYALSNFGVMEPKKIKFGDIDAIDIYAVGPFQYPSGALFTVSTYNSKIHITCGSYDENNYGPIINNILDKMINEINKFTKKYSI